MKSLKSELSRELKNKVDKELNKAIFQTANNRIETEKRSMILNKIWIALFNNELHEINLRTSFHHEVYIHGVYITASAGGVRINDHYEVNHRVGRMHQ